MTLLIINHEYPPIGGGAANASMFLANEWINQGHVVHVITSSFKNTPSYQETGSLHIHRINACRKKEGSGSFFEMALFMFLAIPRIINVCRNEAIDHIMAFFTIPGGALGLLSKTLFGTPYTVLLRGGDVPGFKMLGTIVNILHRVLLPVTKKIWRTADAVVANSDGLANLARRSWNGKISIVPNGVDCAFFKPADKIENLKITMLYAGRLAAHKGLIEFMDLLSSTNNIREWKWIIVGDGPERNSLITKAAGDPILKDRVRFMGWLNKDALLHEYQMADIFVFPSFDEGMPNAMLEAMACGLPILATRIAGNEELVIDGKNGYLYDVGDTKTCQSALYNLWQSRELRLAMGQISRHLAVQRGWDSAATQLLQSTTRSTDAFSSQLEKIINNKV